MRLLFSLFVLGCAVGSLGAVKKRDRQNYVTNSMRVVCYMERTLYDKSYPFQIEDIDVHRCTHVIFGFAKMNEYLYKIDNEVPDPYGDPYPNAFDFIDKPPDAFKRFNKLRKLNPELTTIISIGGWYEGSEKYSDMARNQHYRKNFVDSAIAFLQMYDFDGLDLNWQYPGTRLGDPTVDRYNYLQLVRELRAAFDPHGYLLTAAMAPAKDTIDLAYHIPELNALFDFMNIMTYDYHGGWEEFYGHNAPLYRRPDETDILDTYLNVNYTMNYYLSRGATRDKLVMGVPFYGRAWSMEDPNKHNLRDSAKGKSPAGLITREQGVIGYNELCQMMHNTSQKWTTHYDEYYQAPYAYNGEIWVGYDDIKSLSCKLAFLKQLGISGVMVWSLDKDDFQSRCGPKNPLLTKVWDMINGDEKNSFECELGVTTAKPSTPILESSTQTEPTTKDDSHNIEMICKKQGLIGHPYDIHKYIVCSYVATPNHPGLGATIMNCAPGTRWHDTIKNCIFN